MGQAVGLQQTLEPGSTLAVLVRENVWAAKAKVLGS